MNVQYPRAQCVKCQGWFTILQLKKNNDGGGYLCKGCCN